jgi:hypothetical protein
MSQQPNHPENDPKRPGPNDPGSITQEVRHNTVAARVPEKVARGVFSTGVIVLQGQHEFSLDFVQCLTRPFQLAARVILPPAIVYNLLAALRQNLDMYQGKFGTIPPPPAPPPGHTPPPIEEIYEQLKFPDEQLSGVYANFVTIAHTHAEFVFDFITNCYPRPVVSSRVYLAAPQVPVLLNNLARSFQQFQQRMTQQQQHQQPPGPPPTPPATP